MTTNNRAKVKFHAKCTGPFFISEFEGTERQVGAFLRRQKRIHDHNIKSIVNLEKEKHKYKIWKGRKRGYVWVTPHIDLVKTLGIEPLKVVITKKEMNNTATLKTAIGIADMFPPLYRRAIVEAVKKSNGNTLPFTLSSKVLHGSYFMFAINWEKTKEGTDYWYAMYMWWANPEKHPFPDPHPSWEKRFPKEWKEYHGQLPYEF